MFAGFMIHTWIVATMVAMVAGVVGFFVVLRGSSFAAHALPQSAFPGAGLASLLGMNTLIGLGVFALSTAIGIGWLSKRGRHDVVTALTLVTLLGLGNFALSYTTEYASSIDALLFGEVLGVSSIEVGLSAAFSAAAILAVGVLWKPLLLTSILPEASEARGMRSDWIERLFLGIVALSTAAMVPVVGAFLTFALMIGSSSAGRCFSDKPFNAAILSVVFSVGTMWSSLVIAYQGNWPVGFPVGILGLVCYAAGRFWMTWRTSRRGRNPLWRPVVLAGREMD